MSVALIFKLKNPSMTVLYAKKSVAGGELWREFFFLGFRHWRSSVDRVANRNTTIQLALFWRTWTRALATGSTRPHVLAWHMGRDYSYCRVVELTARSVASFFPDFSKIRKNWRPSKRLFSGSCPGLGRSRGPRDRYMPWAWNLTKHQQLGEKHHSAGEIN